MTDFERVIALETQYIRNWSLWADVVILPTVPTALVQRGALSGSGPYPSLG